MGDEVPLETVLNQYPAGGDFHSNSVQAALVVPVLNNVAGAAWFVWGNNIPPSPVCLQSGF